MALSLISHVFEHNSSIPAHYTCDGDNVIPPFVIEGVPEGTDSLVLLMDDPDIPNEIKESKGIDSFDHWVLYNIPADTKSISNDDTLGSPGVNSAGGEGYTGPCPPADLEPATHRYIFRLYAVSQPLNFVKPPTLEEVERAAKEVMLEKTELIGLYGRSNT